MKDWLAQYRAWERDLAARSVAAPAPDIPCWNNPGTGEASMPREFRRLEVWRLFRELSANWVKLTYRDKAARGYSGYRNMPSNITARFVNARLGTQYAADQIYDCARRHGLLLRDLRQPHEIWHDPARLRVSESDRNKIGALESSTRSQSVRMRCAIIRLASAGESNSAIARRARTDGKRVARSTVIRWRRKYLAAGVASLAQRAGRRALPRQPIADFFRRTDPRDSLRFRMAQTAHGTGASRSTVYRVLKASGLVGL